MSRIVHYLVRYMKDSKREGSAIGTYARAMHTREFRSVRAAAEFVRKLPTIGGELHSVRRLVHDELTEKEQWMLAKILADQA